MTDRKRLHTELLARVKFFDPDSKIDELLMKLCCKLLETFPPDSNPSSDVLVNLVQERLPPAKTFFCDSFFANSLYHSTSLRLILEYYKANPVTIEFRDGLKLLDEVKDETRVNTLVFLCRVYKFGREDTLALLKHYGQGCRIQFVEQSTKDNLSTRSDLSGTEDMSRRIEAQDAQIQSLTASIHQMQSASLEPPMHPPVQSTPGNENFPAPRPSSVPQQTPHTGSGPYLQSVNQRNLNSYSSIGQIPVLPRHRPASNSSSNYGAISLMKVYSSPYVQFAGTGDLSENLATYHQAFMNNSKSIGLTESEALANLHVLFRANSPASIFYHRFVLNRARSIDEAFKMLYDRFSSAERRDRLLYQWNNLSFKDFESKPKATKQSALRDLCQTASLLQLQLGPSYQDEQHLRDTLMNACKLEPWAHRLTAMHTGDIKSVQESLAKAITAEETMQELSKYNNSSAALVNVAMRPGMPFRRYENPSFKRRDFNKWRNKKEPDGKNPIRNNARLLCRKCKSDEHLLRECPELSTPKRVSYAALILGDNGVLADSEECNHALDIAQGFDDATWSDMCCENSVNDTNFSSKDNSQVYTTLADVSFHHSITRTPEKTSTAQSRTVLFTKQGTSDFEGICMDDGAEKSLAGLPAFKRYCNFTSQDAELIRSTETFRLGEVIHKSIGQALIRIPIDTHGNFLEYTTDVIDCDIPILFGLDKMKDLRWYVNEVTNEFCSNDDTSLKVPLKFFKGHLYLTWPASVVLFTRRELLNLHRRFAHPSTTKLMELLKIASPEKIDDKTRKILNDIVARCNSCQRMAKKPFVFQVTMPDNILFNHEIYLDLAWIEPRPHKPVLHVVDRGTHFSAAQFVPNESAEAVWNTFISCWVSLYIGFPNVIGHDQGSVFTSDFFQNTCAKFGIISKATPTESHNSLGPGERYHAPLRKVYNKVKLEFPKLENDVALSIAVHGLNITANPEGLIPTLLVFGSIPKLPLGCIQKLSPNQRDRFRAMELAKKEMEIIVARQRVKVASSRTKAMNVFNIPPGNEVLVYREKPKEWQGPYKLYKYDNYKTAYVEINGGIEPFSITAVKPYLKENEQIETKDAMLTLPEIGDKVEIYWPKDDQYYPGVISHFNPKTQKHHIDYDDGDQEDVNLTNEKWHKISTKSQTSAVHLSNIASPLDQAFSTVTNTGKSIYVVIVKDPLDPRFIESARKEIKGLLDRGTYVVVNEEDIPPGAIVLKSRVIHAIKTDVNGNETYKTRLVIQGHRDPEKGHIVNEAPTILRSSTRIILALANCLGFRLWSRDVKQAFIQSEDKLNRELYVRPPKKPNLLSLIDQKPGLLQAIKPLYGLSESPTYWWHTFKRYHIQDLGMTQSILDPCLFFKKKESELIGIIGTLVDDTLGAGTSEFAIEEEEKSAKFDVKARESTLPMMFGGAKISQMDHSYHLSQQEYSDSLKQIPPASFTSEDFAHLRGQLAYVATSTRPDVAYVNAQLAQVVSSEATAKDVRLLNSAISTLKEKKLGLLFTKLDKSSLVIRGYADAGFATNKDCSSQLGMIITLCDKDDNAAILHFSSWKSRRVTRSVLAAEVYALSACYDYSFTVAHDLSSLLGFQVPIQLFTDSKSIFDTITKLSSVSEKRLMIDLSALRQSYASGEIQNLGHILSEFNIADALTKKMNHPLLSTLLDTGKLSHPVNQWIVHFDNIQSTKKEE